MPKVLVGIDCGATHLRVGLVTQEGKLLASVKEHSPLKFHPNDLGNLCKIALHGLLNEQGLMMEDILGIGIGTPGPIDFEKGELLTSSNLANAKPIPFVANLEKELSQKIYFDKDTNCALLGEAWVGAAKDKKNVVMLTLGTGVGGAVMFDGTIAHGTTGYAGEIGHMFLKIPDLLTMADDYDAPECGLGHKGCFEALIKSSTETSKIGYYLGYGLASCVDLFNPEMIVIGGGMIKHGDFLPDAIKIMKEKGMFPAADEVEVVYTKLEDTPGIIGAAKLALEQSK